jgi:hypothetical protein
MSTGSEPTDLEGPVSPLEKDAVEARWQLGLLKPENQAGVSMQAIASNGQWSSLIVCLKLNQKVAASVISQIRLSAVANSFVSLDVVESALHLRSVALLGFRGRLRECHRKYRP